MEMDHRTGGFVTKATKKSAPKRAATKDVGAPISLITSLLVGAPFLAILLIQNHLTHKQDYLPTLTMGVIIIQGLSFCFYWRRIRQSVFKTIVAGAFTFLQWLFMSLITAEAVFHQKLPPEIDFAMTICIITLGGLIGLGMLFGIVWGIQSKGTPRALTLSLSVMTATLGAIIIVNGTLQHQQLPGSEEELTLSAKDFEPKPQEISEPVEEKTYSIEDYLPQGSGETDQNPSFIKRSAPLEKSSPPSQNQPSEPKKNDAVEFLPTNQPNPGAAPKKK